MKYQFVGDKIKQVGKTLWEIVGNLKNFGVGRLVKTSNSSLYPELSFFKIVKVQPLPPRKNQFENRHVLVWIEEVFRNVKHEVKPISSFSYMPKFQLIPKIEEGKYLEALDKLEPRVKNIPKYSSWPPLYKILYERKRLGEKNSEQIPKLKLLVKEYPGFKVIRTDEESKPITCSLYKGELSVHEMYQEIVRLKLLIKNNEGRANQ